MKSDLNEIAAQLKTDLSLSEPPVQISYTAEEPTAIAKYAGEVPSGCTYWGAGTAGTFYARLSDHLNCEIGAFVMGVQPDGELKERLFGTVGQMESEGYLAPGEAMSIPRLKNPPAFVCYGPLGTLPYRPDVVVMFVTPSSAMIALETASEGKAHPLDMPVTGRPACSIIPYVINGNAPVALSFGCTGFRTYVDLSEGKVMLAVRGDKLEEFAQRMKKIVSANLAVRLENTRRRELIGKKV